MKGSAMQNYAKVGGILSIVAGGIGCLLALAVILLAVVLRAYGGGTYFYDSYYVEDQVFLLMTIVYAACGVIGLVISALAIVGGVFGIKRKNWGMALAGSIAGVLTFFPCGIVAVIFTALGKSEFNVLPAPRTV
jgi:hypothetical protein